MNGNDTTSTASASDTSYLTRPGGRIGYDVAGEGPLVVLVPGMGDLRAGYRFLAPALRTAGYRVACTDLRGHGDSDAAFPSYGDEETAGDVSALIEELGGPAVVVGNSMAAGSAVLAAVQRQDPDFRDPAGEANWIAQAFAPTSHGAGAGHYPQSQQPGITTGAILRFLARCPAG